MSQLRPIISVISTFKKALKISYSNINLAKSGIMQKAVSQIVPFMGEMTESIKGLGRGFGRGRVMSIAAAKPSRVRAPRTLKYRPSPGTSTREGLGASVAQTGLGNLWKRRIESQKFLGRWALPTLTTTVAASSAWRILQGRQPYKGKEGGFNIPGVPGL